MSRTKVGLAAGMGRLEEILARRNTSDRPYAISVSYGMSHYDGGDLDDFMRDMDEGMYAMKATHHSRA